MMSFRVNFHRYGNGVARLSAPHFIQAENFFDAARIAQFMRSAMAEADLANDYIVASVGTVGLQGAECSTGWETAEEFSERVKA